jgi:hypothetical protein
MGLNAVDPTFRDVALSKLKLQEHPPSIKLIQALRLSPSTTETGAKVWFEALHGRIAYFSDIELKALSNMSIVPAKSPKTGQMQNYPPNQCYFLTPATSAPGGLSEDDHSPAGKGVQTKLFASVDYKARANALLLALGAKEAPSVDVIAHVLVKDPREFWALAGGRDVFLSELKNTAEQTGCE